VIYENIEGNVDSEYFVILKHLPNSPNVSLIEKSKYNIGLYQISLFVPENTGYLTLGNVFTSILKRGYVLPDSKVQITDSYISEGFPDLKTNNFIIPITIEYKDYEQL